MTLLRSERCARVRDLCLKNKQRAHWAALLIVNANHARSVGTTRVHRGPEIPKLSVLYMSLVVSW